MVVTLEGAGLFELLGASVGAVAAAASVVLVVLFAVAGDVARVPLSVVKEAMGSTEGAEGDSAALLASSDIKSERWVGDAVWGQLSEDMVRELSRSGESVDQVIRCKRFSSKHVRNPSQKDSYQVGRRACVR